MGLFANLLISVVLIVLSIAVFSADLGRLYSTVSTPVTNGNVRLKNVSLMICVESETDGFAVDTFLNALSVRQASATFFVCGGFVMKNFKRVKDIYALGFELGNLGFSGKSFKTLPAAKQKDEILDTHTLVKGLVGVDMKLFSPPNGEYTKDTLKTASALGYTVVLPSKPMEPPKNGDLILVCPAKVAIQDFENLIDSYIRADFCLIKVSDNIAAV